MLFSQLRLLLLHLVIVGAERSFTIANDRFLLDGQATRLLASEMHYCEWIEIKHLTHSFFL